MKQETPRLHILLTEDDPAIAELFKMVLSAKGCEIVIAANGKEALEKWQGSSFDLILMDLNMPGIDGFEVTRTIRDREDPSRPRTPIVAMTAHIGEDDQRRCEDAGMNGCVSKQAGVESLYDIVRRHIVK